MSNYKHNDHFQILDEVAGPAINSQSPVQNRGVGKTAINLPAAVVEFQEKATQILSKSTEIYPQLSTVNLLRIVREDRSLLTNDDILAIQEVAVLRLQNGGENATGTPELIKETTLAVLSR